jgi:hypothetical protein
MPLSALHRQPGTNNEHGLQDGRDLGHSSQRSVLSGQLQLAWLWTLPDHPMALPSVESQEK